MLKTEVNAGVYLIRNLKTGKAYIGCSMNVIHRWGEHVAALRSGCHHVHGMQKTFNQHGMEAFSFKVLELTQSCKCLFRETLWIKRHDKRRLYNRRNSSVSDVDLPTINSYRSPRKS